MLSSMAWHRNPTHANIEPELRTRAFETPWITAVKGKAGPSTPLPLVASLRMTSLGGGRKSRSFDSTPFDRFAQDDIVRRWEKEQVLRLHSLRSLLSG